MTPRVSFVIPAYNAERWISKAINSCRNQTVKQLEIIVVNDGSTDFTKDIIEWHAEEDKRVRVFHQENKGRSAARNFGNSKADSGIILVLDSDDMSTKNRAKETIAAFDLKKADLLYGSFFVVDAQGTVDRKVVAAAFNPDFSKEKKFNFICHSTMAYKTDVASTIKYDETEFSKLGLDDWKFQWDVHRSGFAIRHVKTPLCYYRTTEDNTTQTRNGEEVLKAKDKFLETL